MSLPALSSAARRAPRSGIRDVFDRVLASRDVISFAVGEPSESAAPHIVEAARATIAEGDTHYTDVAGIPAFREAAADYTRHVKRLDYDAASEVQATPGATMGLFLAMRAVLDPGDEVIIGSPHFTSYDAQAILCGATPVYVPLRPENGLRMDADDIEAAVTPRTRAIVINSPGNPTGAVTPAAELDRIARVCVRHNLWAISDEVYHAFVFSEQTSTGVPGEPIVAPSIAASPGMRERTIIIDSLSKTYAMTGWRVGYLSGPSQLIEVTGKIAEQIHSSVNGPAQHGAIAALLGPQDAVAEMRTAYAERRRIVMDGLATSDALRVIEPQGAFYAFVDVRRTGLDSGTFWRRLFDEERVAVVPGDAFGGAGNGFVRISYAGATEDVREGVRRLRAFAERIAEEGTDGELNDISLGAVRREPAEASA